MVKDYRRELQGLLRKLFQFDSADLDFGIYRIMNYKRDEIARFIERDLIEAVDAEFEMYSSKNKVVLERELEELKRKIASTLGENVLLPSGDLREMYKDSPSAKEYNKKKDEIKSSEMSDQHKAEIFSHIYHFFSRYYDEGDFISQRRYSKQNKYAIPYNGEEILLHWANKDQYYIKTGEYFKNYSFRVGEYKVNFRLLDAETDQNNNRSGNRFFLLKEGNDQVTYDGDARELTIFFEYRALTAEEIGRYGTRDVQKQKVILDDARSKLISLISVEGLNAALQKTEGEKTLLEKHLLRYTKRNTTDYFIHKDIKDFLLGELDFYIKNEVLTIDDLGSENECEVEQYIGRIKVIKAISLKIIEFLAQIEEFQKKLFEKKKFIIKAEYCMTLDRVPIEFYSEIIRNEAQIAEWIQIFRLDKAELGTLAKYSSQKFDVEYLKSHPYLLLDTRYFDLDFKDKLIASFERLDEEISGVIIKSENWQALSLLERKYREQVTLIYIDPPYNTGMDGFPYKDNYKHSSWITMMYSPLYLARSYLRHNGLSFVSTDENEALRIGFIMDSLFGESNRVETIIWKKSYGGGSKAKHIVNLHEYIWAYALSLPDLAALELKPDTNIIQKYYKYKDSKFDKRGPYRLQPLATTSMDDRPNLRYALPYKGRDIWPEKQWQWSKERALKALDNDELVFVESEKRNVSVYYKQYLKSETGETRAAKLYSIIDGIYTQQGTSELRDLFGEIGIYTFPKPSDLVKILCESCCLRDDIIMDFFAGSGTTAHAILNLNREDGGKRKFILIEMGDYVETVLIPRIKKVIYSRDWQDGRPTSNDGISQIFKYMHLEQYEDTLNSIEFAAPDLTIQRTLEDLDGYFLRYVLDFETRDSSCRFNVDKLNRPFDYTLKITHNNEMRDEKVDLVETFNYLLGLHVKRIKVFYNNGAYYKVVHGMKDEDTITIVWRATAGLDLKADKEFLENKILKEFMARKIYINSDFFVDGAISIEPEFKRLMGA